MSEHYIRVCEQMKPIELKQRVFLQHPLIPTLNNKQAILFVSDLDFRYVYKLHNQLLVQQPLFLASSDETPLTRLANLLNSLEAMLKPHRKTKKAEAQIQAWLFKLQLDLKERRKLSLLDLDSDETTENVLKFPDV